MEAISDFLEDWSRRWSEALAVAVDGLPAEITGGRIYAAALTVADGNTVPGLVVQTGSRLAEVLEDGIDDDPEESRYYRWWPDETGVDVEDDALGALSTALGDWAETHSECTGELDEGGELSSWRDEWIVASDRALIAALGSDPVRQAFARLGADPVLVVTETDGGAERALGALDALNSHRDDVLIRDARAFWEENVAG